MSKIGKKVKITKRVVDLADPKKSPYIIWDKELPGFGLRIAANGRKAYIVSYRVGVGRGAKQRRVSIAASNTMTCEMARKEAQVYLANARLGEDRREEIDAAAKAKADITVAKAIEIWHAEAAHRNRRTGKARDPRNIRNEMSRMDAHLIPAIGNKKLRELTRRDVELLRDDITAGRTAVVQKTKKHGVRRATGGAGTAKRTMVSFKSVLAYMKDIGFVDQNVAANLRLAPDGKKERYLSVAEAHRLGKCLDEWEQMDRRVTGITIIRLLLMTGARTKEIEELKWSEIDFDRSFFRFEETKSGRSIRPISPQVLEILKGLPRLHPTWVFLNNAGTGPYCGTQAVWRLVREEAGLPDVRKHDLRHSFASFALANGLSLPVIGTLLGHSRPETTQRYAHLSDRHAMEAARSVGLAVMNALEGRE
ncbi:MAG: tyrosine-type recombinase/integrase [Parvibaculaceae bacterium]